MNTLTEREKYLMKLSWLASDEILEYGYSFEMWVKDFTGEDVEQKFKPIVKKVDPDNLPEGDVFAIINGELLKGDLEFLNGIVIGFFDGGYRKTRIFNYIEQEDLLELFKGENL